MSEKRERYLIEPEFKKSACEEQYWSNTLKHGLGVTVKVGNLFRWGSFYININEKEKNELLSKESVLVNEYEDFELIEMLDGGCDFWVNILDEDDYTEKELEEINRLLYKSSECSEDDGYDEEKMYNNGWLEMDCEYILTAPLKLDKVEE